jgi:hypothetical protein
MHEYNLAVAILLPFTSVNGYLEFKRQSGFNPILIFSVIFAKCRIR